MVAPLAGAWIEIVKYYRPAEEERGRPPRGGVD